MKTSTRRARALALLPLLGLASGCVFTSPSPKAMAQNEDGTGERMSVVMQSEVEHSGELLAVTDSTLVMLVANHVAEGRLADVRELLVQGSRRDNLCIAAGRWCSSIVSHRAMLLSRFPYGITPAGMAVLLARTGQSAPASLLATRP